LNRRTALLLLAVMLGSVLVTYFALQRRSRHLSVTDIDDSRVKKISRVGPIQLRVPLYLPPKTQTLAVELSYDGEVWNSFLHAVTMLSLDEVYQFYRQRYSKSASIYMTPELHGPSGRSVLVSRPILCWWFFQTLVRSDCVLAFKSLRRFSRTMLNSWNCPKDNPT
jgi:hypothetical protein